MDVLVSIYWSFVLMTFLKVLVTAENPNTYKEKYFKTENEKGFSNAEKITKTRVVKSETSCVMACMGDNICCTASFDKADGVCKLNSQCNPTVEILSSSVFISGPGVECLKSGFLYDTTTDRCYIIKHNVDRVVEVIHSVCASMSSQLIKIPTQEKQDWISTILMSETDLRVCIQGNNENSDNEYKFDDGTPMVYFNWYAEQPNEGANMHLIMRTDRNFEWGDWGITSTLRTCLVVCEK